MRHMTSGLTERTADVTLSELIHTRRSIRAFREEPLPRTLVEELLHDVLWAPSPHNSQPWRFTVLFDRRDKEALATAMATRLAEELRAAGLDDDAIERQTERSRRRISF